MSATKQLSALHIFLIWVPVAALGVTLVLLTLSPLVLSNIFVFQPKQARNYCAVPKQVMGAYCQAIAFHAPSGSCLYGFYIKKPHSQLTVLLHHGQGENLSTHFGLTKTMLMAGFSVLTYDYEGFGMSEGSPSNKSVVQDGEAAYDFLVREKHIDPDRIIDCGVSLGTGVASSVAMARRCAGVILISPYTSLNQVAVEHVPIYRWYPRILFPDPDLGSQAFMVSNRTKPVLLIHGAKDPIISVHQAEQLQSVAQCPCLLIVAPNARHGDFSTVYLAKEIREFGQRLIARQVYNKEVH